MKMRNGDRFRSAGGFCIISDMPGTWQVWDFRRSLDQTVPHLRMSDQDSCISRMIVSGGAGILVCRKRARKMRMDDSNSVGNMAMSKKCNVGKITQKQG